MRKIYLGELPFQKGAKFSIPYVLLHILLVAELEMECLLHSEGGNNKTLLIEWISKKKQLFLHNAKGMYRHLVQSKRYL